MKKGYVKPMSGDTTAQDQNGHPNHPALVANRNMTRAEETAKQAQIDKACGKMGK